MSCLQPMSSTSTKYVQNLGNDNQNKTKTNLTKIRLKEESSLNSWGKRMVWHSGMQACVIPAETHPQIEAVLRSPRSAPSGTLQCRPAWCRPWRRRRPWSPLAEERPGRCTLRRPSSWTRWRTGRSRSRCPTCTTAHPRWGWGHPIARSDPPSEGPCRRREAPFVGGSRVGLPSLPPRSPGERIKEADSLSSLTDMTWRWIMRKMDMWLFVVHSSTPSCVCRRTCLRHGHVFDNIGCKLIITDCYHTHFVSTTVQLMKYSR